MWSENRHEAGGAAPTCFDRLFSAFPWQRFRRLSPLYAVMIRLESRMPSVGRAESAEIGPDLKKGIDCLMAKKKVADLLVEVLAEAGVRRIYGVSGDSLNGITDSLRATHKLQWVHLRHEETAAFAAGAEAPLTGTLAVCAGSCGPGNLHLINGLYHCHRSRVPVLAIAAHIPSHEIGSNYFQETHPERLFLDCSHYCELVSQPEQMPRTLEIAMQTAISRQGVAVVVLPGDIALK